MQNNKIVNFLSWIVYLFPLSIIIGNFYSNFIVAVGSLTFFIYSIIKRREEFNNPFFKIFLIFWFLIVVRSLFTSEILFSFKSSFLFIRYALFCLLVKFLILNNKYFLKNFFKINVILLIFISIDALIQFYFGLMKNLRILRLKQLVDSKINLMTILTLGQKINFQ